MLHLGEVPLVGTDPACLGRVADLVDAVDAAGAQQRLVQRRRHVGRHHDQDPVLGRRLRPHAEDPPDVTVDEAAWLLQPGQLGEQGLQRAHAAAATPVHHPADHLLDAPGVRLVGDRRFHRVPGQPPLRVLRQVGEPVAAGVGEGGTAVRALLPAGGALGHHAAVAQRVGLVEEDDHAAIAQREPAQLAEERLDLEDAHAHEHVDEGAGVDEHVRPAGLARHRLGHQRLARPGRAPKQQAARHVAAPLLDQLGVLQEDDVLLDPREHVILAPDVGEPGLDVVGVVHVHPAAGHEPEEGDELEHDEQERKSDLQHERQHVPDQLRRAEQRQDRRGVDDLADHHGQDHDPQHPGQDPP